MTVTEKHLFAGGVAGTIEDGNVTSSYSWADVTAVTKSDASNVGPIRLRRGAFRRRGRTRAESQCGPGGRQLRRRRRLGHRSHRQRQVCPGRRAGGPAEQKRHHPRQLRPRLGHGLRRRQRLRGRPGGIPARQHRVQLRHRGRSPTPPRTTTPADWWGTKHQSGINHRFLLQLRNRRTGGQRRGHGEDHHPTPDPDRLLRHEHLRQHGHLQGLEPGPGQRRQRQQPYHRPGQSRGTLARRTSTRFWITASWQRGNSGPSYR